MRTEMAYLGRGAVPLEQSSTTARTDDAYRRMCGPAHRRWQWHALGVAPRRPSADAARFEYRHAVSLGVDETVGGAVVAMAVGDAVVAMAVGDAVIEPSAMAIWNLPRRRRRTARGSRRRRFG